MSVYADFNLSEPVDGGGGIGLLFLSTCATE